jgi:hypothetical protein
MTPGKGLWAAYKCAIDGAPPLHYCKKMPAKKKCLLHANCQGEPLRELLLLSVPFAAECDITHYTNYLREEIPATALAGCDLFLYQHLVSKWEELSSSALLSRLNTRTERLCLPNMFFKGLWPFWVNEGPMDFSDVLLEKLLAAGAEKPEILKLYLHGDIRRFANLDQTLADTFQLEEENERLCGVRTLPLVKEFWKSEMLFHTCNHPGKRLLAFVADSVLKRLGYPPLRPEDLAGYQPEYANFDLPFHPVIAAHHGLGYGGAGYEFNVFGRPMDFGRYVSRYIEARRQGVRGPEFLAFLQLV